MRFLRRAKIRRRVLAVGALPLAFLIWAGVAREARGQGWIVWHVRDPSLYPTTAVAAPGDIDGDGVPDLVRGAAAQGGSPAGPGTVTAYSGANGEVLYAVPGGATGDAFGASVASLDDADGDGVREVLVGAPQWGAPATGPGYARILSGAGATTLLALSGAAPGNGFGSSVDGMGDVNGDGVEDVAVSAPGGNYVNIFSGANGAILHTLTGSSAFGPVAGVGDADGDAIPDLVVGNPSWMGSVRLYSGSTGALLWSVLAPRPPTYGVAHLGHSVAGPGDVNGDGLGDALAGAPGASYSTVLSGIGGAAILTLWPGWPPGSSPGESVAGAGDLNGDGVPDLIVGSPADDYAVSVVHVHSGATGSILFACLDPYGSGSVIPIGDLHFGRSIAAAEDVNRDGVPDILVGNRDGVLVFSGGALPSGTSFPAWGACPYPMPQLPFISMTGGPPAVGNGAFSVTLSGAPSNATAVLVAGLAPLPAPLPVPSVACPLFVSPDFVIPRTTNATGVATAAVPIPPSPLLAGAVFYFQWYSAYGAPPVPGRMTRVLQVTLL